MPDDHTITTAAGFDLAAPVLPPADSPPNTPPDDSATDPPTEAPIKRGRGRPRGVKNKLKIPVAPAELSRCPRCGSTNRGPYFNRRELVTRGERNGIAFNLVVWRRTACKDCGQIRDDKTFEFRGSDNSEEN